MDGIGMSDRHLSEGQALCLPTVKASFFSGAPCHPPPFPFPLQDTCSNTHSGPNPWNREVKGSSPVRKVSTRVSHQPRQEEARRLRHALEGWGL